MRREDSPERDVRSRYSPDFGCFYCQHVLAQLCGFLVRRVAFWGLFACSPSFLFRAVLEMFKGGVVLGGYFEKYFMKYRENFPYQLQGCATSLS